MLKIYNTMSQSIEEFKSLHAGEVNMYVCGPTVYNYFHIGNARVFLVFDTIRKYLEYSGYKVKFAQNVTDIDDKIIKKAASEGVLWSAISEKYTTAYLEDLAKLNVTPADINPKATEEIPAMLALIQNLMDKGIAYVSKNGVYYDVTKFEGYGKLSHQKMDELVEGARVEVDEEKKNPLDFALWKFSKPGEPSWEAPWGAGRPGWHIECSAMSGKHLGATFDIHGGGADLVFPHHENERAQSEAANGVTFVNYWMHVGYLNIRGEKMSKSKGNFAFIRDILNDYMQDKENTANVIRLFILSAHYRGPLDFSNDNMDSVRNGYREIYYTAQRLAQVKAKPAASFVGRDFIKEFKEAMDEDFNTSKAIACVYDCAAAAKTELGKKNIESFVLLGKTMLEMCAVLKITPVLKTIDAQITELAKQIDLLRKEKQYEKADILKKQAAETGYMLEFTAAGTFAIKELK